MKNRVLVLSGAAGAAVIAIALVLALTQSSSPARPRAAAAASAPARSQAEAAVIPSSLVLVPAFGANPSGLEMDIYVPNSLRPHPGILLALHWGCASGTDFYEATGFSTLADEYGFIVIYPSSPYGCFDTSSASAQTHDGGSDPVGLMSMITYTERKYHADPHRVFVTGASAGGMMAADMLADYPDVFAAGAIFEATPFGCPLACTGSPMIVTPQYWGNIVRHAYPGYHGPRPRVQIWHGTADANVLYANFGEEIKQWTNVLGVSQKPLSTAHPQSAWTRTDYGTGANDIQVEAYSLKGEGHYLPEVGSEVYVIRFFGLDQG